MFRIVLAVISLLSTVATVYGDEAAKAPATVADAAPAAKAAPQTCPDCPTCAKGVCPANRTQLGARLFGSGCSCNCPDCTKGPGCPCDCNNCSCNSQPAMSNGPARRTVRGVVQPLRSWRARGGLFGRRRCGG